jgi:hypothetical protein
MYCPHPDSWTNDVPGPVRLSYETRSGLLPRVVRMHVRSGPLCRVATPLPSFVMHCQALSCLLQSAWHSSACFHAEVSTAPVIACPASLTEGVTVTTGSGGPVSHGSKHMSQIVVGARMGQCCASAVWEEWSTRFHNCIALHGWYKQRKSGVSGGRRLSSRHVYV